MKIVLPSFTILAPAGSGDVEFTRRHSIYMLEHLERAGRLAYKSEDKISEGTAAKFVSNVCRTLKHESVMEHCGISVQIVCDRGITHELVRHRLASYTQESTRYCSYDKGKFGSEITVIKPPFWSEDSDEYYAWRTVCEQAENSYMYLMAKGAKAQEARDVLPNSLKTEIFVSANLRQWGHIFKLRTAPNAHPQMREIMVPLANEFATLLPELFEKVEVTA